MMVSGLLLGLLLVGASLACRMATQLTAPPQPVCTPPLCGPDEVYYCPDECPGGCGTICATPTPTASAAEPPTPVPKPVCTPPPCGPDEVYYCPDECPGGCGTICATPTPTASAAEPPTPASSEESTVVVPPAVTELPVSCEQQAWGWFEGALEMVSGVREQIGCPTQEHRTLAAASQDFQYGYMLWRGDEQLIYVFYDNGGWENYPDRWQEGMLEQDPSFGPPPEGLIQPKRGFGLVWQEYPAVHDRLGWAVSEERLCDDAHSQVFQRGFMLECTQDVVPRAKIRVFVSFDDHAYTIYSPP